MNDPRQAAAFAESAWLNSSARMITDLPIFSMLRERMQWHQQRQRVLAENVANADTPNYKARDLAPLRFEAGGAQRGGLGMARTSTTHLAAASESSGFALARKGSEQVRPTGNAVQLEDEMLKVASNQMDYQAATTLYTRSLGLLKMAIVRK